MLLTKTDRHTILTCYENSQKKNSSDNFAEIPEFSGKIPDRFTL
jgi:hypothetical protein